MDDEGSSDTEALARIPRSFCFRMASCTSTGSCLSAMHQAAGLPLLQFIALLAHGARHDPAILACFTTANAVASPQTLTLLLPLVRALLPENILVLDMPTSVVWSPFGAVAAWPERPTPTFMADAFGSWTFGFLTPALAEGAIHLPNLPAHLPSFIGGLGCLAALDFASICRALHELGLSDATLYGSLSTAAALVQLLPAFFPTGVIVRCTGGEVLQLLHGDVRAMSPDTTDQPHLYLQCDELAHFQPHLHMGVTGAPPELTACPVSACWVAVCEPGNSAPESADCFFRALNLHRSTVVSAAMQVARTIPVPYGRVHLHRLRQLRRPHQHVGGFDIHMLINLLPHWFPDGLLLLHASGLLLRFCPGTQPESLLPEDVQGRCIVSLECTVVQGPSCFLCGSART